MTRMGRMTRICSERDGLSSRKHKSKVFVGVEEGSILTEQIRVIRASIRVIRQFPLSVALGVIDSDRPRPTDLRQRHAPLETLGYRDMPQLLRRADLRGVVAENGELLEDPKPPDLIARGCRAECLLIDGRQYRPLLVRAALHEDAAALATSS